MIKRYLLFLCLAQPALLLPVLSRSQPDLNNVVKASGITCFHDIIRKELYYYLPGDLQIGETAEGIPDFSFILMRYAGSASYHDEGRAPIFRNVLTMKLVMKEIDPDSLRNAARELQTRYKDIVMKPLPISRIEAMIVFTPVGAPDTSLITERGEMAAESTAGYGTDLSFWRERYFTVFPDNNSANLLLEAFRRNLTVTSFMYAFYCKGLTSKKILELSGYGTLYSRLQKQLQGIVADSADGAGGDSLRECLVKSDAFPIRIDTAKNPGLIRKIDINDAMPPGYAVLNVRDYDFANHLRSDLYEKTVELEATGAGGDPVNLSVSFNLKSQDITSVNFRFRYAVRLDKPYRYRVHELLKDGSEIVSGWNTMSVWSNLLDVTSRPPDAQ